MKILVCGTSVVMPNLSWPGASKSWTYYLQQRLDCEIVNIGRAGCGNHYMHDAVLAEVTERQYDLVLVSWNLSDRVEFRTCHDLPLTDWIPGNGNPHEQYMQRDWIWAHTPDEIMPWPAATHAKNQLIEHRLKLLPGYEVNHQTMLTQVLSLQSTLKQYNVPYMFTFYRKLLKLSKFKNYYDRLDFNNILEKSLYRLAKDTGQWNSEISHPTNPAYKQYADLIYDHLSTRNLIVP